MKGLFVMLLLVGLVFAACDTDLSHEDHDHDGDGVQDHSAEEHADEEHDEDYEEHAEEENHS